MTVPENITNLRENFQRLFELRAEHSNTRLRTLVSSLDKSKEIKVFSEICMFTAGSYARLEASEHSDIDLFFVSKKDKVTYGESYNVPMIRMMSEVVRIGDELGFPKFSNDGQYLRILHVRDILNTLGGNEDDYTNNFTARLLMILESKPVFGHKIYQNVLEEIIESYYRDYPDHEDKFRPNFLINDISRFWKTLCLNYENKRNQRDISEEKRVKQKIKNFKLKYSRLSTCFSSIAYLTALEIPVSKEQVLEMTQMTPSSRLRSVARFIPEAESVINLALEKYHWFLERTGTTEIDLFSYFEDEDRRRDAFLKASEFGNHMFNVLKLIDSKNASFRYLVI
jgi:hypothetical protein